MKRILSIVTALTLLAAPVLAGESKTLRQKLDQARQVKTEALASHQLEAELMKEVKREKQAPAVKPAKLAAQK